MITIDGPGRSLTEEDLTALETTLRAKLPDAYRAFLLSNNGGVPSPDIVHVEGAPGSPTDVQVFFGIDRSIQSSDLYWNMRTFSDRLPETMLPFACDSGGNLFCIYLTTEDAGSVIYVDLDQPEPCFYYVADGFDAFLDKLTEGQEIESI
jgi:hypothetical protein